MPYRTHLKYNHVTNYIYEYNETSIHKNNSIEPYLYNEYSFL